MRRVLANLFRAGLDCIHANVKSEPFDISKIEPTAEMRKEAKQTPNGWVYAIQGNFGPTDPVPPEAIAGAWRVDASGNIIEGSYVANPNFRGKS
jgi:hypothetical protein